MQRRLKIRTRRVIGKLIGKLSNSCFDRISIETNRFWEDNVRIRGKISSIHDRVGNLRSESVKEGISIKCNAG